ncbi:MAG: flagellin [SAR324 cluster bacterium]|nr:flagellin [SAR324 cluster bacterium]MBL7035236.1 flagellin [SAR324 cluster bacterium]
MRVNHNTASMSALRHLNRTTDDASNNLERLSSGLRINSAADGPAELMISEQMRSQISGLNQAVKNSETSISMVQTAEGVLSEFSSMLISMRQLAIHAANNGATDEKMLQADQMETEELLANMDRIAGSTQFGSKILFDGSNEVNGVTIGDGLTFVGASALTRKSPTKQGYEINIEQVATRAEVNAERRITLEEIENGVSFVLKENNRILKMDTKEERSLKDNLQQVLGNYHRAPQTFSRENTEARLAELVALALQRKADDAGLDVEIKINDIGMLTVKHKHYGSQPSFGVSTNIQGLFGEQQGTIRLSNGGQDVVGTIGGNIALGEGQYLHGAQGSETEGIIVQYDKELGHRLVDLKDSQGRVIGQKLVKETNEELVGKEVEGFVHITQNSVTYQVGANHKQTVAFSLNDLRSVQIARGVKNDSNFSSLADIDMTSSEGAQDSIKLIDSAIMEIGELRGNLGSFQRNSLESNLRNLRVSSENLTNAESVIRDSDMAAEMSDFTKNQILIASGTAMAAQANQIPKSVLQLISSASQ